MIALSLLILAALLALAAWQSPKYLRHAAAHLIARAEALDSARLAHADGLRHWKGALGVGETRALETLRKLEAR